MSTRPALPVSSVRSRRSRALAGALVGALAAAVVAAGPARSQESTDEPAPIQARTVLPPGNSMLYTADGQAAGTASGQASDYGTNVDDQRQMYWDFEFKDGALATQPCVDPQTPRDGVQVCFDDFGVPHVWGESREDVWFGAGYAVAQIRLFLMDAVRRTARGTLAELTGPGTVPEDVATRVLTYTPEEYQAIFDRLSQESKDAVTGYVDGANAWIAEVTTGSRQDQIPAEYGLLGATPEPLTTIDVAAIGVLMTRFVASEGGTEMNNVLALQDLEAALGRERAREVFTDLVWVEDEQAAVSVPREEGVFPRTSLPASERDRVFDEMADWAVGLPPELATGSGTGDHPEPTPGPGNFDPLGSSERGAVSPAAMAQAALREWTSALTGGSFAVMISPDRTADGSTILMSEPQLGYNPVLLVELEVHGGGYNASGVSVPGIPTVGIGYTNDVAWALTTGNAKTIDSYIETTREDSNGDGAPEYLHDGTWKEMDCRTEEVRYRPDAAGTPSQVETVQACRTVHGPVVAWSEDRTMARSVQYHMWMREVDTVEGVLRWNRARNLDDFIEAMRLVTWNENTGYADRDGNIAWFHPGIHLARPPESELRLPMPGTGEYDLGEPLAFDDLPHAINPAQGWLANWNNKPAHGWLDGVGMSLTSYPAGIGARVDILMDQLEARDDWTFESIRELDRHAGTYDIRAPWFLQMLLDLRNRPDDLLGVDQERDAQLAALELMAAWDGSASHEGADMQFTPTDPDGGGAAERSPASATVGAAPYLFDLFVDRLVDDVLGNVDPSVTALVTRQLQDGNNHEYDMTPALHLVLRILDPATSSLAVQEDWLRGRTPFEVVSSAWSQVVAGVRAQQGDDPGAWRGDFPTRPVCSPTGGIVGPCPQMPFLERGTWIHHVAWPAPPTPEPQPEPAPLPATGGGAALGALLALAVGARRRRG